MKISSGWRTRTRAQLGIPIRRGPGEDRRFWGAMKRYNQKHGRDTATGGIPFPPDSIDWRSWHRESEKAAKHTAETVARNKAIRDWLEAERVYLEAHGE